MTRRAVILTPSDYRTYRDSARKTRFQLPGNRRFALSVPPEALTWCSVIAADPIEDAVATIGGVEQPVRWLYTLRRNRWDYSTQSNVSLGLDNLTNVTNTNEDGNDGSALGPGYLVSAIPPGLEYCPAGYAAGGYHLTQLQVAAWSITDPDGTVVWRCYHSNTIDGDCE